MAALLGDDVDGVLEDVVLARPLTQWTSRPHLEQLRENVSSSRSRSTFSSSRVQLDDVDEVVGAFAKSAGFLRIAACSLWTSRR